MDSYSNVIPLSQASFSGKLPSKPRNRDVRSREYLTGKEVEQLMAAARKAGRHGHRDATLILVAYRHGLRVKELVSLRWDQVDLGQGLMHVNRLKNGTVTSTQSVGLRSARCGGYSGTIPILLMSLSLSARDR